MIGRLPMWRLVVVLALLVSSLSIGGTVAAQEPEQELPTDLAGMVPAPAELGDSLFQFARGGYVDVDEARFLIEQRYRIEAETLDGVLSGIDWQKGYTGTLVLLSDRSNRRSDPLESVTVIIHEMAREDDATVLESFLISGTPENAEPHDAVVADAITWRIAAYQDDLLRTVIRDGRYLIEVDSSHRRLRPDAGDHAVAVTAVLERIRQVEASGGVGLSQRLVRLDDARMIPVAVATESPLAHAWYRMIDGDIVPAAGELNPSGDDAPDGATDIFVARQTAEIGSQSWVTVGMINVAFASTGDAGAFVDQGIVHDPLDTFPSSEDTTTLNSETPGAVIESISGEAQLGGSYSGFRVTLADGAMATQMTIRATGTALIDREAVETWALLQMDCLTTGACSEVPLTDMLSTTAAATPDDGPGDEGTYVSSVAPWSLRFDPSRWQVRDTLAEDRYDYLYLRASGIDATFETIVDHRGDPEQCVLDELDRLRDSDAGALITIGSDAGDPPGGMESDHAWVTYTVEPLSEEREGEEYTIRIDCYTVVPGAISLVVQVRAPRSDWPHLASLGDDLRAGIEIDGPSATWMTGDRLLTTPSWRNDDMINRRPWIGLAA